MWRAGVGGFRSSLTPIWVAACVASLALTAFMVTQRTTFTIEGPRPWMLVEALIMLTLIFVVARWAPGPAVLGTVLLGLCFGLSVIRFPGRVTPVLGLRGMLVAVALWITISAIVATAGWGLRQLAHARTESQRLRSQADLSDQRLQVARDLHDFVGHDVSEVVALVQAAPLLADEPERLRTVLATIEQAGLRSLESLDVAVAALHEPDPPQPGIGMVHNVVARFNTVGGGQLRWLDETNGRSLPDGASSLIYRTAVEALTNIRRHAPESSGTVRLEVTPTWMQLTVTNTLAPATAEPPFNGPGRSSDSGGRGLTQLSEQATDRGGHLTAGPTGADWQVKLILPMEET